MFRPPCLFWGPMFRAPRLFWNLEFGIWNLSFAVFLRRPNPYTLVFHRAFPFRARHIDRQHLQPVTLRVLNDRKWLIKAHRLIVERGRGERRQVMTLQVSAGVSNQSKTGGV